MLGHLLKPECEELIAKKDWASLRTAFEDMDPADIAEVIHDLPAEDSGIVFRVLPRDRAAAAFEYLPLDQQAEVVGTLKSEHLTAVLDAMAPDDRTRLFQELPAAVTRRALETLSPAELKIARTLLGYAEKTAGRYMTPEYVAVNPSMTAALALERVRISARSAETVNLIYVVDDGGVLLADLRLATLVMSDPSRTISALIDRPLVRMLATAPRDEVIGTFEKYHRTALPVTDSQGVMLGIITSDDVLDVAEQKATEDIQRLGGLEALDAPYLEIALSSMLRKRGSWLAVLFLGELLTSTAMGYFEGEIARAVVLSIFLPLIISSGGNSGSQSTSLIIRSLAVRELALRDWWRVLRREILIGTSLGALLCGIGVVRIVLWQQLGFKDYGAHYMLIALTVGASLVGVVLFGSLTGAMLPFVLRRIGFDPAAASAPFVATLVDVTGLVIYFSVASAILRGTLL